MEANLGYYYLKIDLVFSYEINFLHNVIRIYIW